MREQNKVRCTGSTIVKFIITEGRSNSKDIKEQGTVRLDILTLRQQTETKNIFMEFHTSSFDRTVSDLKEINTIVK